MNHNVFIQEDYGVPSSTSHFANHTGTHLQWQTKKIEHQVIIDQVFKTN